jgi:hypothetical protein
MRIRRRRAVDPVQPSLVPMVDLLSNTVGALVFIMIFTVMAASGVVVLKRLPLEHSSKAEPINFLCENDRIIPLNNIELGEKLRRRWGRPYSIFDLYSWIARFDGLEVEDEHFIARGESTVSYSSYSFSIQFTPKPGGGDSLSDLQNRESTFRGRLAGLNPKTHFVHFFVRPDSIDSFLAARQIATEELGMGTGWMPIEQDRVLRFSSQGRTATGQ